MAPPSGSAPSKTGPKMYNEDLTPIRLVEPTEDLRDGYVGCVHECRAAGDSGFHHDSEDVLSDFAGYVRRLRGYARGKGVPPGYVPSNNYWLVRDGRVLAVSRLRHRLTDALRLEGGHIGYAVRPSERRKGYGTRLLALTLDKARERGLDRVMVTCDKDNFASARIIQKNGGVLESEGPSPRTDKIVERYWIDLGQDGADHE
jgi:predicted acetyltransferase